MLVWSSISKKYQDLAEAFSKWELDILPPHHPMDCAIEILPGAKLAKLKMYSMTPREMEELKNSVDKNLARDFIQMAKSRMAALGDLQGKKDGSLRLCMDF